MRHPLNRSREVAHFHSPGALAELLAHDFAAACAALAATPNDHPRLRPYQVEANAAVEHAIAGRQRRMLVAMATGTGKTFVTVNQVYRLLKAGVARRVLFLVDRRAPSPPSTPSAATGSTRSTSCTASACSATTSATRVASTPRCCRPAT